MYVLTHLLTHQTPLHVAVGMLTRIVKNMFPYAYTYMHTHTCVYTYTYTTHVRVCVRGWEGGHMPAIRTHTKT